MVPTQPLVEPFSIVQRFLVVASVNTFAIMSKNIQFPVKSMYPVTEELRQRQGASITVS